MQDIHVRHLAQAAVVGLGAATTAAASASPRQTDTFAGRGLRAVTAPAPAPAPVAPTPAPQAPAPAPATHATLPAPAPGPYVARGLPVYLVQQGAFLSSGAYRGITLPDTAAPQSPLQLETLDNGAGEKWEFIDGDRIRSFAQPNYCITATRQAEAAVYGIVTDLCSEDPAQQFHGLSGLTGGKYGPLTWGEDAALCIQTSGDAVGAALQLAPCDKNSLEQHFTAVTAG